MKRETKEAGNETRPGKGVAKEEKFPNTRKPSHRWVCGEFWNLAGKHNREGKKRTHSLCASCDFQQRGSPDAGVGQKQAEEGGAGCGLRVRTGPECPEDNLGELTRDSSPNCGTAREKNKKDFPATAWPAHRTKD